LARPWPAVAQHILVIWGDDIVQTNVSAYLKGLMGYRTPNIDGPRTSAGSSPTNYTEQSCTAGPTAFITGRAVFRSGQITLRAQRGAMRIVVPPREMVDRDGIEPPTPAFSVL